MTEDATYSLQSVCSCNLGTENVPLSRADIIMRNAMIINGRDGDTVQRQPLAQIVPHPGSACRQLFVLTSTPKFSKKVNVLMKLITVYCHGCWVMPTLLMMD